VIVCIDACFTQKRMKDGGRKGQQNRIPVKHPDSFWIDPADINDMEEYVHSLRPSKGAQGETDGEKEDKRIGNMRVALSYLAQCGESFLAADEKREKASTAHYSETGVMAMLCRHDKVLYTVNMTSAGEKQHYGLTLITRLFAEVPAHIRIGLMYDIGCQIHCSCEKWGFLEEFRDRIEWAISVFHAAGHEWACQCVYHPRKRKGFGLSDGEGCERFWWKLSPLIRNLRVQGYYSRLYTLDSQMEQINETISAGIGTWIVHKWNAAQKRWEECQKEWNDIVGRHIDWSEEMVLKEWEAQVVSQTKPLPRQAPNIAKKIILDIITLQDRLHGIEERVKDLEKSIAHDTTIIMSDAVEELDSLATQEQGLRKSIKKKIDGLSTGDRKDWKRLEGNKFLAMRMNALAVKRRLRERVRMRRFEIDALQRHESKQKKDSHKLTANAKAQINRREPTIKNLLKKYNALALKVGEMQLKRAGVPQGAQAPLPIQIRADELWDLDVDSDIWNDIGLTDEEETDLPLWLADDDMRKAIKNRIESRRCVEEGNRLQKEVLALQSWAREEWACYQVADTADWSCASHRVLLEYRQREFKKRCGLWRRQLRPVWPSCGGEKNWGPSPEVLEEAAQEVSKLKIGETDVEDDEGESMIDDHDEDERAREEYANLLGQYD